jgi:hypothetical protein
LPEPRLLDAAHIVMDAHEPLGQPIVSNGLPLTKLHHAAFDAHLIGIDLNFRFTSLTGCSKSTGALVATEAAAEHPLKSPWSHQIEDLANGKSRVAKRDGPYPCLVM